MTLMPNQTQAPMPTILIARHTDAGSRGQLAGVVRASLVGPKLVLEPGSLDVPDATWLAQYGSAALAVCELPDSRLVALGLDDGELVLESSVPTGGANACHVAVWPQPDEEGRFLAGVVHASGILSVFRLAPPRPDSPTILGEAVATLDFASDAERTPQPRQLEWLDLETLLVTDAGTDQLRIVQLRQGEATALEQVATVNLPAGTGPRHLVTRRMGNDLQLAVCGEGSAMVLSVRHEGLDWADGWRVGLGAPSSQDLARARPADLHLFGDDLVVANRGTDTVALLRWSEEGAIQLVGESPCGGSEPLDLVEHAGLLLVANHGSDQVGVLAHRADGFELVSTLHVPSPTSLLVTSA